MKHWPVTLIDAELTLRPLRRRDERSWSQIRERGQAWFAPWDATMPPGPAQKPYSWAELVTIFKRRAADGQMLPWALEVTQPDGSAQFVGQVTVSGMVWGSACWGQIGYWIDPVHAGRGYIPRAVAMACDHAFAIGLHRMEVAIRPENVNSLAVVRKLGFRYEGSRPRYMHVDGDWRDHELFALNAEEVPGGLLARYRSL